MGNTKKKLDLLLLCFFFGLLGVHRFYAGKIATGVLMPLSLLLAGGVKAAVGDINNPVAVAAFLITPLWWLVDLVRIISGHFTDKKGVQIKAWV